MAAASKSPFADDAELVEALVRRVEELDRQASAQTGACGYVTPDLKQHCAELSKSNCDILGGVWDSTTHCKTKPDPQNPKECKAN